MNIKLTDWASGEVVYILVNSILSVAQQGKQGNKERCSKVTTWREMFLVKEEAAIISQRTGWSAKEV